MGLCCNDCFEVTNFGNILEKNLGLIWSSSQMSVARKKIGMGRLNYEFCRECDVIDAGGREKIIKEVGKHEKKHKRKY